MAENHVEFLFNPKKQNKIAVSFFWLKDVLLATLQNVDKTHIKPWIIIMMNTEERSWKLWSK